MNGNELKRLSTTELYDLLWAIKKEIKARKRILGKGFYANPNYVEFILKDLDHYEALQPFEEENCYVAMLEVQRITSRLEKYGEY